MYFAFILQDGRSEENDGVEKAPIQDILAHDGSVRARLFRPTQLPVVTGICRSMAIIIE